jgi:hypothetical protein
MESYGLIAIIGLIILSGILLSMLAYYINKFSRKEDPLAPQTIASLSSINEEVKDNLKRFQGRKGHELLLSMMAQPVEPEELVDEDSLRERFVKKIYDDRFNEALPYVYRAYKHRQKMDTPGSKEFESWANEITEETWDNDTDDQNEMELMRLFQTPLAVGFDGTDAIAAIAPIAFLQSEVRLIGSAGPIQGPIYEFTKPVEGFFGDSPDAKKGGNMNGGAKISTQLGKKTDKPKMQLSAQMVRAQSQSETEKKLAEREKAGRATAKEDARAPRVAEVEVEKAKNMK